LHQKNLTTIIYCLAQMRKQKYGLCLNKTNFFLEIKLFRVIIFPDSI
jgi:hypothetical protein